MFLKPYVLTGLFDNCQANPVFSNSMPLPQCVVPSAKNALHSTAHVGLIFTFM